MNFNLCFPDLLAGGSVQRVGVASKVAKISEVFTWASTGADADGRPNGGGCLIHPIHAASGGVDGVDRAGVDPKEYAAACYCWLAINCLRAGKSESPF